MGTPCTQESTIGTMVKTLDCMEKSQERVIELLERVANQDARIEHLEEHKDKCVENAEILFERVRDLELNEASSGPMHRENVRTTLGNISDTLEKFEKKVDKLNRFFYVSTHRYALMVYAIVLAMIVGGTVFDFIYHWDSIKAAWLFWNGR